MSNPENAFPDKFLQTQSGTAAYLNESTNNSQVDNVNKRNEFLAG